LPPCTRKKPLAPRNQPQEDSHPTKFHENRGYNSSEDDATDKTAGHLKKDDHFVIIKWLKIEWNYNSHFELGRLLLSGVQPNSKELFKMRKNPAQLPAFDMQHAPAKLTSKLYLFAC
ncbi:hypothetical protein VP01_8523g1, partial [Puccinia sorghi]